MATQLLSQVKGDRLELGLLISLGKRQERDAGVVRTR
jgi:hypothetical protein